MLRHRKLSRGELSQGCSAVDRRESRFTVDRREVWSGDRAPTTSVAVEDNSLAEQLKQWGVWVSGYTLTCRFSSSSTVTLTRRHDDSSRLPTRRWQLSATPVDGCHGGGQCGETPTTTGVWSRENR